MFYVFGVAQVVAHVEVADYNDFFALVVAVYTDGVKRVHSNRSINIIVT
ncbi:hypothetical protein SDC9_173737 [bioreactor metagenome]|uniref:Uncharacterized protein n=1 Tax=bioreactor metagenome TaxID=1076179 RepID=A0A645GRQ5_9ZZZZ